jgi:tRNA-Thr(GGU) m(6)t(6)A37 methyltransferase TsaA
MSENDPRIILHPIGTVRNDFDESTSRDEMRSGISRIALDPAFTQGLAGANPGDQIMVLFHFNRSEGYELLQHPRGNRDRPRRGVFTLRSPRRPNPIGLTTVQVLEINKNILTVRGLDAFNGTPVLDLKPA